MRSRATSILAVFLVMSFILGFPLARAAAAAPGGVNLYVDPPGTSLKLRLYYYADGSGDTFSVYAISCTASTGDVDYSYPTLNVLYNWNNQATAWRDYSGCDVKFYTSTNFGGTASSWQNSAGNLAQMSSTYDRNVESWKLS